MLFASRATCAVAAAMVGLALIAPADASPITYNISFSGGGTLPTSASFQYDPNTAVFSSFIVNWAGYVMDFTASANAPTGTIGCTGTSASVYQFLLGTGVCPGTNLIQWNGFVSPGFQSGFSFADLGGGGNNTILSIQVGPLAPGAVSVNGTGHFTVAQATPEPSTALQLSLGLLFFGGLACLLPRPAWRRTGTRNATSGHDFGRRP